MHSIILTEFLYHDMLTFRGHSRTKVIYDHQLPSVIISTASAVSTDDVALTWKTDHNITIFNHP